MGLAVKQETSDEAIDAAPLRSAAMQWPLSSKFSTQPQLLSFHGSHEENPKTGFDSLASAGLVTITTSEIESDHKSYSGIMQNTIVPEKQGGIRYTVTTYPTKHFNSHSINHPVTNQTKLMASPAMGASFHQSFVATAGHHTMVPLSPQPISAVPMPSPVQTMPSSSSIVGTTDLRNSSKISGAPAQLTIFYNGSVCVYDNVSADKAQAIMLLAGNGPPTTSNATAPAAPVQISTPRPSILESFVVNHPYGSTTHRSSPAAKTSISLTQSIGWPGAISSELTASKQGGILVSSNKVEPMKIVNSPGPVSAMFLPSSTVPQFRRKSLARFLEKRKERVINAAPYGDKESPECNSSGSCPVPAVN